MTPGEAKDFITQIAKSDIEEPRSFEEQGMKFVGEDLYRAFFDGYTRKQWGMDPSLLPASILKRLPLRFNYDDNYFNHPFQGMPKDGYTSLIERMIWLAHDKIEIRLGCPFEQLEEAFQHVFYTGPLDRYFKNDIGRLTLQDRWILKRSAQRAIFRAPP